MNDTGQGAANPMKFNHLPERVLYYEPMSLRRVDAIWDTCRELGLEVVMVAPSKVGECLGFLAGYEGFSPSTEERKPNPPTERVLIFCGVVGDRLEEVMKALKERGAPPALQAVLTKVNVSWPMDRLVEELQKERAAIARNLLRQKKA